VNALHAVTSIGRPRGTDSRNRTRTTLPLIGQMIVRRLDRTLSTSNNKATVHATVIAIIMITVVLPIVFLASFHRVCMEDAEAGLPGYE
jgi:hypothetical protein